MANFSAKLVASERCYTCFSHGFDAFRLVVYTRTRAVSQQQVIIIVVCGIKAKKKKVSPHNQVNRFIIIALERRLRLSIVVPLNNGCKTFFFLSFSWAGTIHNDGKYIFYGLRSFARYTHTHTRAHA